MLQLFQFHYNTALFILWWGHYGLPELISVRDCLFSFVLEAILWCTFFVVVAISLYQKLSVFWVSFFSFWKNCIVRPLSVLLACCPVLLLLCQFCYTHRVIFHTWSFCYSDDTVDKNKCFLFLEKNDCISFLFSVIRRNPVQWFSFLF